MVVQIILQLSQLGPELHRSALLPHSTADHQFSVAFLQNYGLFNYPNIWRVINFALKWRASGLCSTIRSLLEHLLVHLPRLLWQASTTGRVSPLLLLFLSLSFRWTKERLEHPSGGEELCGLIFAFITWNNLCIHSGELVNYFNNYSSACLEGGTRSVYYLFFFLCSIVDLFMAQSTANKTVKVTEVGRDNCILKLVWKVYDVLKSVLDWSAN